MMRKRPFSLEKDAQFFASDSHNTSPPEYSSSQSTQHLPRLIEDFSGNLHFAASRSRKVECSAMNSQGSPVANPVIEAGKNPHHLASMASNKPSVSIIDKDHLFRAPNKKWKGLKDGGLGQDMFSDYDPPVSTRAGQYARLVKQGRKEEALKRAARRVIYRRKTVAESMADDFPKKLDDTHINPSRRPQELLRVAKKDFPHRLEMDVEEEEEVQAELENGVDRGISTTTGENTSNLLPSEVGEHGLLEDHFLSEEDIILLLSASQENFSALREIEKKWK